MSALLDSPEAKALKDAGHMVGDREVVGLLLRELLRPEYHDGVIIDGFPRTTVQVECLKLLVDQMHALRREFFNTPLSHSFPASDDPHHGVVRRGEGIDRAPAETGPRNAGAQRGGAAHRRRADCARIGRPTTTKRWRGGATRRSRSRPGTRCSRSRRSFTTTSSTPRGPFEKVEQNILQELQYQSTLELDPRTVERLRGVPVASEIIVHARQELVKRLDSYELEYPRAVREGHQRSSNAR